MFGPSVAHFIPFSVLGSVRLHLRVKSTGFFLPQLQGLFLLQTRLVLSAVHAVDTGITYRYFSNTRGIFQMTKCYM